MTNFQLLLAAIGLTFILKYGFILNVPRNWLKNKSVYLNELLSCSQCLGFWCGLIVYFIAGLTSDRVTIELGIFSVLFGFLNSFIANATDMVMDLLDEKVVELRHKNEKNGG